MSTTLRGGGWVFVLFGMMGSSVIEAQQPAPLRDPEAFANAVDAYVYGYPLVTLVMTKRLATNVAGPEPKGHAPINQLGSLYEFPPASFRFVVAPNVNTLYTSGFLDLSREPMVVSVPDTRGRYWVMELLDGWTNVFGAPGKRTTGTEAQSIAILGPGWQGQLPTGITHSYRSNTNTAWLLNRIQTNGPGDYAEVNELQRAMTLVPLSVFGRSYTPPGGTVDPRIDMKTSPSDQVNALAADSFFGVLALAMRDSPPAPEDARIVARMARIGIVPGRDFDIRKLDAASAEEVRRGARAALQKIKDNRFAMGTKHNGWQIVLECGRYGTNYLLRASVTLLGLGCNLKEDGFYPTTFVDGQGAQLSGAYNYVLRFPAGQEPPVNAFWSVTMYDTTLFMVENPIHRQAVSSWMDLRRNSDGSLDLYIQNQSPGGDMESNWLPAPTGPFVLMLRLYWPKEEALKLMWKPPAVQRR